MMGCPCGCDCCECPCPSALPTVLFTWSGSHNFSTERDIDQMPGWTEELERFYDSAPCGYLWRIVGFEKQAANIGHMQPGSDVLAFGPVRERRLFGESWINRGDFGGPFPPVLPPWYWAPRTLEQVNFEGDGFFYGRYELQLGAIRCECEEGLYIVWPDDGVSRPVNGIATITQEPDGVPLIQRLTLPRTTLAGTFVLRGVINTTLEWLPFDASLADIKTAVESILILGSPGFTAVNVTGGPLPSKPVFIESTPMNPDWSRLLVEYDYLHMRRNGFECRRMTTGEEDARAWAGDEADPAIVMPCRVDVLTDYARTEWASVYTRLGWVEPLSNSGFGSVNAYRLNDTLLEGLRVLVLGSEGMLINFGQYTIADPAPRLDRINQWLAEPGRVLVLNGAIISDADDPDEASVPFVPIVVGHVDNSKMTCGYLTQQWNRVLEGINGCQTRMIGICKEWTADINDPFAIQWDVAVDNTIGDFFGASTGETKYKLSPVAGDHPLLEHATEFEWSEFSGAGEDHWNVFPLEFVGHLQPAGETVTLYEITQADSRWGTWTANLAEVLPGIVVEKLPSGSYVVVSAILRPPGEMNVKPDALLHAPVAFLRDLLNKLPYD